MSESKPTTIKLAEQALIHRFQELTGTTLTKGRTAQAKDNFLPGVDEKAMEAQHKGKAGTEWPSRICSIRSSAALVANTFGRWIHEPQKVTVCGFSEFDSFTLERECSSGLGGTKPHLDVVLESKTVVLGIESKLLEPLEKGSPAFSSSYAKDRLKRCEDNWWQLLEEWRLGAPCYFDAPQIIKHYLGLRNTFQDDRKVHLLYLYWEPQNHQEFPEFQLHAQQLREFAGRVANSAVTFHFMTHSDLWNEWLKNDGLREYTQKLIERYGVMI